MKESGSFLLLKDMQHILCLQAELTPVTSQTDFPSMPFLKVSQSDSRYVLFLASSVPS